MRIARTSDKASLASEAVYCTMFRMFTLLMTITHLTMRLAGRTGEALRV
jgi:hypothetical protein